MRHNLVTAVTGSGDIREDLKNLAEFRVSSALEL